MGISDLTAKASALRALHAAAEPLVLPNAWDAASAILVAEAGFSAVATTSAGVAWAFGRPDGQVVTRDEMLGAVAHMAAGKARRTEDVPQRAADAKRSLYIIAGLIVLLVPWRVVFGG
mgnify:CR=1 FL=1